jgi:uncharacterized membrane protein
MDQNLAEHHASITVNAPVHQVYSLFTHFNDFPKFMSFVREVTYYDELHSHWVANVVGQYEWDAINENWVDGRQIGWRSYNGLENTGRVTFQTVGPLMTQVDVFIAYNPPAGALGDIGEKLGVGSRFDQVLQHDLDNFARMVDAAPPGALDPQSSNYLFHSGSAAAQGKTTESQDATMRDDFNAAANGHTTAPTQSDHIVLDRDIINEPSTRAPEMSTNAYGQAPLRQPDRGISPDATTSSQDTPNRYPQGVLGQPDRGISYDPTRPSEDSENGTGNV